MENLTVDFMKSDVRPFGLEVFYTPSELEKVAFPEAHLLETPGAGWNMLRSAWLSTPEDRYLITVLRGGRQNGVVLTLAYTRKDGEEIWAVGEGYFRFPLRTLRGKPYEFLSGLRGLPDQGLTPIDRVPGFRLHDSQPAAWHDQGWYTRSLFTWELDLVHEGWSWLSEIAPGVKVWGLREGAYLVFPDAGEGVSYRLIPWQEWRSFVMPKEPCAHQGDLLVWKAPAGAGEPWDGEIDRHRVAFDEGGINSEGLPWTGRGIVDKEKNIYYTFGHIVITHPEHPELDLVDPDYPTRWWGLRLLPGTSRPFARRPGGVD